MEDGKYDVFISYRRITGKNYARVLKPELEKRGFSVFLDFDELKDGVFDQRIKDAIENAPVFLVILSEGALDRCINEGDWVREEIIHANKTKRHIVPVEVDKSFREVPKETPEEIKQILGAHQFSQIDTETLLQVSLDKMVEERIQPFVEKRTGSNKKLLPYWLTVLVTVCVGIGAIVTGLQKCGSNDPEVNAPTTKVVSVTPSGGNLILKVGDVAYSMIHVEGGSFTMGATNEQLKETDDGEKPTHSVTLSDYYIGETEVTQALWQAVMGSNPSNFTGDSLLPVEEVSWEDCQEFIGRLNSLTSQRFRLPTEAEWEYAARGGDKSCGYKFSGSNDIGSVAWYDENSGGETHPVKTKLPNELGIYDMSGNVYEWCQDWYGSYSNEQTNATGASGRSYRESRGGGWGSDAERSCVSFRGSRTPSLRFNNLGLRLAL